MVVYDKTFAFYSVVCFISLNDQKQFELNKNCVTDTCDRVPVKIGFLIWLKDSSKCVINISLMMGNILILEVVH